jgi:hypothetical protein
VEVGEAVVSLDVLDAKLNLTVSKVFIVLKVSEGYFHDASLEFIRCDFGTGSFGDDGLSKILIGEHGRRLKFVPFFSKERVLTVKYNTRETNK